MEQEEEANLKKGHHNLMDLGKVKINQKMESLKCLLEGRVMLPQSQRVPYVSANWTINRLQTVVFTRSALFVS